MRKEIKITAAKPVAKTSESKATATLSSNKYTAIKNKHAFSADIDIAATDVNIFGYGGETIPEPIFGRYAGEDLTINDLFSKEIEKGFNELINDIELITKLIEKLNVEPVTIYELFNRVVEYNREIYETTSYFADPSYTYEAGTSRHTYTLVPLVLKEFVSLDYGKGFEETSSISDSFLKEMGLNFVENKILSEIISFSIAFNRVFSELVDATDDFYGEANIDDDQYAAFGKTVNDIPLTFSDVVSLLIDYGVNVSDTILGTELIDIFLSKLLSDNLTIAETLLISLGYGRAVSDSVVSIDYANLSFEKLLQDYPDVSDSGLIYNQNYFLSTFVNPGYTGSIYSF